MKSLEDIKAIIVQNRDILEHKYKVKSLAFFGSYVRGEQESGSDIDIMDELEYV